MGRGAGRSQGPQSSQAGASWPWSSASVPTNTHVTKVRKLMPSSLEDIDGLLYAPICGETDAKNAEW